MHNGKRFSVYGLGIILLLTLAVRFADPVKDGDFFWHVQYGKYMIEHKTLIPDHALYSWTPADNSAVKCNWIADICLYLINQAGGLTLLFAFRYSCILLAISMVWLYARFTNQDSNFFTFLVLIIVLLTSYSASFLDTEIFSMIFFAFIAMIYFSVKSSLWGKWKTKPFLFYPVLFLLWANSHEIFIFGLITLGLITSGEIINYFVSKKSAFSLADLRYLITSSILSLAVTLFNPYGLSLHLKMFHFLKAGQNRGMATVKAYSSIFSSGFSTLHYVEFLVIMIIIFVFLFALLVCRKKEWDWGILLPNIFLAILYARYGRATYYWPAFWGMSLFFLQKQNVFFWQDCLNKSKNIYLKGFKLGLVVLFLFFSGRAVYDARYIQFTGRWLGFGIGYSGPVQASTFLKQYQPGNLLYNSYDIGGYLIYDLYPVYKVFMDPRYFPYKEWYVDYYKFNHGQTSIKKFQEQYPFDVAIVDYIDSKSVIIKFLKSSKWKPVFYGPAAVVFVKKDIDFQYNIFDADKHRFDSLKNLRQAYEVFMMAQNLGDLKTSEYILKIINKKFYYLRDYHKVADLCKLHQEGMLAYAVGDYENALIKLNSAGIRYFMMRTNSTLRNLWKWKAKKLILQKKYYQAFSLLNLNLKYYPKDVNGLYNAGVLGFMIDRKERLSTDAQKKIDWPQYLKRFIKLAPNHPQSIIAKQILKEKEFFGAIPFILSEHADI